ncbi:MAG: hypothetical protein DDT27_01660 [Dehalococcoidia bacterium]|nr:hypothetical protein [Chloroflexota bacterium]
MIEQFRNAGKKGRASRGDLVVGDSCRQMSFARPRRPHQDQPVLRRFGKLASGRQGHLKALSLLPIGIHPLNIEGLEAHSADYLLAQSADRLKKRRAFLPQLQLTGQFRSAQAGLQALVKGTQSYCGNYGGKLSIEAMIQHLEELLLSPGCAAVGSQVIEDEQWCILHPFEEIVVAHVAGGAKRGA